MLPFGIQPLHLIIILVVALLIFGPKRLPEIGRNLGKTITEFRAGTQEFAKGLEEEASRPITRQAAPPEPGAVADGAAQTFCSKCGAPNPVQSRFCNKCGTPLAAPEETASK